MAKTEAEKIGSAVGNDGSATREVFTLISNTDASIKYWPRRSLTECRFSDGSGIIIGESGWDYAAGPDCLCWDGIGHNDDCEA